jgi:DNA-binding CsgD family transcriptional regulator
VIEGQIWIDKEIASVSAPRRVSLTRRERDVVGLLVQGLANKEIAWQLRITEGSVKIYLSRLFSKTGATDRFSLALLALKNVGTFAPESSAVRSVGSFVPPVFVLSNGQTRNVDNNSGLLSAA